MRFFKILNFNPLKLIATFLIGIVLASCQNKQDNFDFSNFKIPDKTTIKTPNKSTTKISKQENSNLPNLKNKTIQNKLITYKKKSDILSTVKIGKKDPFSKGEIQVNKLNSDFKLTGFLYTKIKKYALVNYQENKGNITEGLIGGENTNLLPRGAKVISIDPKNKILIINFEKKRYIFKL